MFQFFVFISHLFRVFEFVICQSILGTFNIDLFQNLLNIMAIQLIIMETKIQNILDIMELHICCKIRRRTEFILHLKFKVSFLFQIVVKVHIKFLLLQLIYILEKHFDYGFYLIISFISQYKCKLQNHTIVQFFITQTRMESIKEVIIYQVFLETVDSLIVKYSKNILD